MNTPQAKHSLSPSLEREITNKVENCLLNQQNKREFNKTLQEQRGEVISAFGDSLDFQKYQDENLTLEEVQSVNEQCMDTILARMEQEYQTYTKQLDNPDFMRKHSEFLHFSGSSRANFLQALEENNLPKAQ